MKFSHLQAIIGFQFFITGICQAQPAPELHLKQPFAPIVIDGDIKEWGDSLHYYSPEERISYEMANNKDTLYLAVKVYERSEVARIMRAGLTFSVDPKGKKKQTFSLTYPLNIQSGAPAFSHLPDNDGNVSKKDREELVRERLTSLRGIKVTGFKDIEDDMITTSNTYGIRMAVNYDDAGDLILEEAIPLIFFHADMDAKNEWAFNLKINGIQRPEGGGEGKENNTEQGGGMHGGGNGGMGGGRHGGGGGRHGGAGYTGNNGQGEMTKSIDFWGKFHLAR